MENIISLTKEVNKYIQAKPDNEISIHGGVVYWCPRRVWQLGGFDSLKSKFMLYPVQMSDVCVRNSGTNYNEAQWVWLFR